MGFLQSLFVHAHRIVRTVYVLVRACFNRFFKRDAQQKSRTLLKNSAHTVAPAA